MSILFSGPWPSDIHVSFAYGGCSSRGHFASLADFLAALERIQGYIALWALGERRFVHDVEWSDRTLLCLLLPPRDGAELIRYRLDGPTLTPEEAMAGLGLN